MAPFEEHLADMDFKAEDVHIEDKVELAQEAVNIHKGEGFNSKYATLGLWETARTFKKAVLVAFMAAIAAACDGYEIIANPGFIDLVGNQHDKNGNTIISAQVLSAISAMISVGQIIGMMTLPFIADRFGRKVGFYWTWTLLAISVALESASRNWQTWLVGKLFAGIGVGCIQLGIPTYITEIAPPQIRGALVGAYNIWWSIGALMAPVALQVLGQKNPLDWKTPVYTQFIAVGIMFFVFLWVPESPWWAASKEKHELGTKLLTRINGGVAGYDVEYEYAIYARTVQLENELIHGEKSWFEIFRGPNLKRTIASGWTLITSQFLGLGLISTYISYFFQMAGFKNPFKLTILNSGITLIVTVISILTVDRVGRYFYLCGVISVGWLCLLAIGLIATFAGTGSGAGAGLVTFALIWNVCNNLNYNISWALMAEVPAVRLRARTAGFGAACSAVAGVTFVVITPYLINVNNANWGLKTCFFFFGIGAPFAIGTWFIVPETARRTPAELDELFESGVKPWRFRKTVTTIELNRAASNQI